MRLTMLSTSLSHSVIVRRTCVADSRIVDLYPDFMSFWRRDLNLFNRKVFSGFPRHSRLLSIGKPPLYSLIGVLDGGRWCIYLAGDCLRKVKIVSYMT